MEQVKLLIVDDEQENRDALQSIFAEEGYEVHLARDGREGLDVAARVQPSLIILDIMMPRMDGFQTCLRLRQQDGTRETPIIFLTSRNEPEAETFGLDLGADDFVPKPFNRDVLKSRVRKRLAGKPAQQVGEMTELGDCTVHWDRQEVVRGEERIPLTTKELGLLRMFVENRGKVLSRNTILERVWTDTYITDRTIDSHVKELRKKIPPMGKLLKTVYGSGYRLDL